MSYNLSKVNEYLNQVPQETEETTQVILSGQDSIKNILISETLKLQRLDGVANELLNYVTDSKQIRKLSYKEKQNLLKTICEIQTNSRDFIFKVAELSNKNAVLQQVLQMAQGPKEIVQSSSGEVYVSTIDDETRKNLSELLRDFINERARNS